MTDLQDSRKPFNQDIKSYDIHTYYFQTDKASKEEAWNMREKLQKDFAEEIKNGQIRVWKFHEQPIGPHPYAMWEVDFSEPEIFAKLVPWYQINHGSLSVLVHPHTFGGNQLRDHTHHAIWIGPKVRLIETTLPTSD